MNTADIIMLIVCTPLLIMMSVLVYALLAVMLKEEYGKNIWPFNKKEVMNEQKTDEEES